MLQLDSATAFGQGDRLLTTRLPDGGKGFSFLIIISVEFDPPLQLAGLRIGGVGGLLGIRRTLDVKVLREGCATTPWTPFSSRKTGGQRRLLNALRSVFPPARDRHLFGLAMNLGVGTPR